jgi:hypothetical protein
MMSHRRPERYVAGLWERNLLSQILWRVDPVYENGRFRYLSSRPSSVYRAPSFSWASVDAERGIKFGDVSHEDFFITLEDIQVVPKTADVFGLVENCHIVLRGHLIEIEIMAVEKAGSIRYVWKPLSSPLARFSNVYLDSPKNDFKTLLEPPSMVYCLPARNDSKDYLVCLLLLLHSKQDNLQTFKRIGLTRISPNQKDINEISSKTKLAETRIKLI